MMRLSPANTESSGGSRESSAELAGRLESIALGSDFLVSRPVFDEESGLRLQRFVFEGPHGGAIRFGLVSLRESTEMSRRVRTRWLSLRECWLGIRS